MLELSNTDAAIRILAALFLGGLIGFEREWRNKSAGLRTYALVCEGSALFMVCSILLYDELYQAGNRATDPSRIASTVVQGVGFLAAGLIFNAGIKVHGLTTAAGIWVTAALGLLIGAGFYEVAIVGVIATIVTLSFFRVIEKRVPPDHHSSKHEVPESEG